MHIAFGVLLGVFLLGCFCVLLQVRRKISLAEGGGVFSCSCLLKCKLIFIIHHSCQLSVVCRQATLDFSLQTC